jgi:YesN/AraC family two-component response regulator
MDTTSKIMIVEDNLHARHALKALVSQQAWAKVIAEASNGRDAIQNIRRQMPDIVLMDMRMPVMDGLEATKIIKAQWPQIKIVILTLYPDCQSDVLSAGADAFLVKGCSTEELNGKIQQVLQAK